LLHAVCWLLQTGKSYFINQVLPALLAEHPAFQGRPVTVMRLDLTDLPVNEVGVHLRFVLQVFNQAPP
jgi:hypothetical protein